MKLKGKEVEAGAKVINEFTTELQSHLRMKIVNMNKNMRKNQHKGVITSDISWLK